MSYRKPTIDGNERCPRGDDLVRLVRCNVTGQACGQDHWASRHTDVMVAFARQQHAAGKSGPAIARELGIGYATVCSWLNSRRRPGHARIVVRRSK